MSKRFSATKAISEVSTRLRKIADAYASFDQIDGTHPYQIALPEGSVLYPVRTLKNAKIAHFNFSLAREMGLIPENHPDQMNPALERKILETFSLQIINEYDQAHRKHLLRQDVKPHKYMATRYLQIQHSDKAGRTSGDGRSIWNGCIKHKGKAWDVSSRGTGVTCLAPGAVEAGQAVKTGDDSYGYSCGLADVDELMGSALMSEIFHMQGIGTERVLTILDLGKGCGIGVRASENLLRPAHLFLWLKQGKREALRKATDYFIQRQVQNKPNRNWKFAANSPNRYKHMLYAIADDFARFAAILERNYIFAWMDWDGDNVLANAGIIDYGSIRQFGLRHDRYRYDDVQRFSTNLNEQAGKTRLILQVFVQLVDFIKTGERKRISTFDSHPVLSYFDKNFQKQIRYIFLKQVGYNPKQAEFLMVKHSRSVEALYRSYSVLERAKTKDKMKRVPDGINRPAVFKMRTVLRELPAAIRSAGLSKIKNQVMTPIEMMTLMASCFARRRDSRLSAGLTTKISIFQENYLNLLRIAKGIENTSDFMRTFVERAGNMNIAGRITGNSAEFIVDSLLTSRIKKNLSVREMQLAMETFTVQQVPQARRKLRKFEPVDLDSPAGELYQELLQLALEYEDDI